MVADTVLASVRCVVLAAAVAVLPARAGAEAAEVADAAEVEFCFNYGCSSRAGVSFAAGALAALSRTFGSVEDAAAERDAIAGAVAGLYRLGAMQIPIAADRAGNYLDADAEGRMDCIDHSTTTTRLLSLLQRRGWLRFHVVSEPSRRTRLIFQHFAAVIEEVAPPVLAPQPVPDHVPVLLALCDCADVLDDVAEPAAAAAADAGARYVVDSWFVDHGEPAVILPLADWMRGEGPNVH